MLAFKSFKKFQAGFFKSKSKFPQLIVEVMISDGKSEMGAEIHGPAAPPKTIRFQPQAQGLHIAKNCQSLGDCWNTICSKRPVISRGLPQNPVFSTGFETVKEIGLNSSLRKSIVVPLGYLKHLKTSPWKIPNSWMVGKSKKKGDLGVPPFWETFIFSSHEVICFEALLFSCPKTKSHWLTDMQR